VENGLTSNSRIICQTVDINLASIFDNFIINFSDLFLILETSYLIIIIDISLCCIFILIVCIQSIFWLRGLNSRASRVIRYFAGIWCEILHIWWACRMGSVWNGWRQSTVGISTKIISTKIRSELWCSHCAYGCKVQGEWRM